jgi:hypothetical protein
MIEDQVVSIEELGGFDIWFVGYVSDASRLAIRETVSTAVTLCLEFEGIGYMLPARGTRQGANGQWQRLRAAGAMNVCTRSMDM